MNKANVPGRPGLRESKKPRIQDTIRACVIQLFSEHGYEHTTVEQTAKAADVSLSTVFRSFPAKEAMLVSDEYDAVRKECHGRCAVFRTRAGVCNQPRPVECPPS